MPQNDKGVKVDPATFGLRPNAQDELTGTVLMGRSLVTHGDRFRELRNQLTEPVPMSY